MNTNEPVDATEFPTPKRGSTTLDFKCLFTKNLGKRKSNY